MSESSLRIIVTGLIAQFPLGGMTWDFLQYVLGLHRLGHDVWYVEDTGQFPYHPIEEGLARDPAFNVAYLARAFERFGLEGRWAYRFPWEDRWFGLPEARRAEVVRTADLLINVSGTLERPADYRAARRMAYIDTDPVFTQVKLARGQQDFAKLIDVHDVRFSFGERLPGTAPDTGHEWVPTRQPVVLDEWRPERPHRGRFTTVMTWASYNPVEFEGRAYGQKDVEFQRFLDLPARAAPAVLELAANKGKKRSLPIDLLRHKGWRVVDPLEVAADLDGYRDYLEGSMAEWSVAKHGYVAGRAGWFSGRSACYLAAGRPVVVQDTGFQDVLPAGEGLLAFATIDEAAAAIGDVTARYEVHARAARAVAEEWFDARKILVRLVERAMAAG